jgi:hypothetical protein
MALARAPFLVPGQGLQLSPQAELTAGFGQQPAQLHRRLFSQLGMFGAAAVGEQIQHGAISPTAENQSAHPWAAI